MMPRSPPVSLPAVETHRAAAVALAAGVEKIAVPFDAKAGEKAFALVARTAWMALTCSPMCSTGPLGAFAGASARGPQAAGRSREPPRGFGNAHDLVPSSTVAGFAGESLEAGAATGPARHPRGAGWLCRGTPVVIRSPTAKPTANDATSAAAAGICPPPR